MLLTVARLDPLKRHTMSFEAVKKLVEKGVDCKLVSIGEGPLRKELEKWVSDNNMGERIFVEPFVSNTIDYFEACDLLIHLSYSEASSHVVKEAGMVFKTALVCKNVGDFDDYLIHKENAFLADKENPVGGVVEILQLYDQQKEVLKKMGLALHDQVVNMFSMEAVSKNYQQLLNIG